ncbi:hypothetical protein [Pannonibacter phragmitetus]|uniref:hypothetical protein n=1 Tax=Pannonibacter phragmitetus TaxID=121719 RepID=UPI001AD8AE37|nr:hypothetical protein [Pannonibacter phragmitetus]
MLFSETGVAANAFGAPHLGQDGAVDAIWWPQVPQKIMDGLAPMPELGTETVLDDI